MIDIKGQLTSATDKAAWDARLASFVAKVKATKLVWFPPGPTDAATKAPAKAKKATKTASKRTTSAAKKATSGAKP